MSKRKARDYPEAYIKIELTPDGNDVELNVYFAGRKIATRGQPDSPQARTWVSLEPGFQVLDGKRKPNGECEVSIYWNEMVPVQ
jgi:hypothetical protein